MEVESYQVREGTERKSKVYHYVPEPAENRSVMEILAEMSLKEPSRYQKFIDDLIVTKGEDWVKNLKYDWSVNGRPKQFMPEPRKEWRTAVWLAGRGFGKTRLGAEAIKQIVNEHPYGKKPLRIALVGATASDVNNVMIGGDSGILSVYPEKERPHWVSTNRKLYWYHPDGTEKAIADCFSAEEPERLRGPQFHFAWCDELAAWRYLNAWDMLMFGLRLGDNPQAIVTTTPKPVKILLDVLALPTTWTTIGSTYENSSNLASAYFKDIITKYEGTTLGRQELMAEIIEEIPNAMFNYENLDRNRIKYDDLHTLPEFLSIVCAIDPATTTRTTSAETGLCVAAYGEDDKFYILHLDAVKESPKAWATRALRLFEDYKCDKLIAEVNNGGDLVETVIQSINPNQKVYAVHASRGKITRAEPVASLYEQNRVCHVGRFSAGEDQMVSFNPIENPSGLKDMVDAMVWAMTWLIDTTQGRNRFAPSVGGMRPQLKNYKKMFNMNDYR